MSVASPHAHIGRHVSDPGHKGNGKHVRPRAGRVGRGTVGVFWDGVNHYHANISWFLGEVSWPF
jgi:hypothetical protein